MDYVPLQVKTSYSLLSSLNNIEKLVSLAKNLGYTSLAITDSNMFGAIEFYKCCLKYQIKPIIGLELTISDSIIILYAKNELGYKTLIKLSTLASERNLKIDDLQDFVNVVLVMPFQSFNEKIFNIFENKYIGYSNQSEKECIKHPKVFISNVLYLNKNDYQYLDYLYMIRDGKVLGEFELNTYKGHHLLSKEEIIKIADEEDIQNSKHISDICNVEIKYTKNLQPLYKEGIDEFQYLTNLCQKGLNKRLNNNIEKKYQDRLNYELSVINKMGFCNYFLVVYDYVKYAKKNNILVGPGRGSAPGSLVAYTLGITEIDPIKYNLLFERFLNPERVTMPDIDIDFDSNKRELVVNYVVEKYGIKNVAGIITFNTLASKQVIKDVGRVLNIPLKLTDAISKLITDKDLITSYNNNSKLKSLINSSEELKKLYDISLHLEGLPRHVSIHAAGIVISNRHLDEVIPLYKNDIGIYTTAYSMNYLEELGLLKMDFLGISNLTIIDEIITNIKNNEQINISFNNIPLDDTKTMEIFKKADTDGIFQFESPGMKNFLKKLNPNSLDDLIAAIALYRPGPMDNIDSYIKRKTGKEPISYLDKSLEPILKSTYGIIIYQEQIMQIANVLAGYSLGEADILRRAMSKKKLDILQNEKEKFIKRSIEKGHSEESATKIFELILKFAGYGFNLSHSVSYAIVAYKMAFLKRHFCHYFMLSLLNNAIGSDVKTQIYISEAKHKKITITPPDINISTYKYIIKNKQIICPFSIIHNIGYSVSHAIIKEREKGPFKDFLDFVTRCYSGTINKKIITSLINAGVFSSFNINKKTLNENLDNIINYAELTKDIGLIEIEKPTIIQYQEYDKETLTNLELSSFSFYLSNHPVSEYRQNESLTTINIEDKFNQKINIILYVEKIKEVLTKKNDVMAFVIASDEFKSISLTLFPSIYQENKDLKYGDIISVIGRVEKRFDEYQIVVNSITKLKSS